MNSWPRTWNREPLMRDNPAPMDSTLGRREFVRLVGSAGVAAAAGLSRFEVLDAAAQGNTAPGPDAAERDLALLALDAARSAGAMYADVRISRHNFESLEHARAADHRRQQERVVRHRRPRAGRRILGLCRHPRREPRRRSLARRAKPPSIAAANDRVAPNTIVLAPVAKVPDGRWITPHRVDPFTGPARNEGRAPVPDQRRSAQGEGRPVRHVERVVGQGKPAARDHGRLAHPADVHSRQPERHRHRSGRRQLRFADAQQRDGAGGLRLGIRDRPHAARARDSVRERSGDEAVGRAGRSRRVGSRAPSVASLADDSRIDRASVASSIARSATKPTTPARRSWRRPRRCSASSGSAASS